MCDALGRYIAVRNLSVNYAVRNVSGRLWEAEGPERPKGHGMEWWSSEALCSNA